MRAKPVRKDFDRAFFKRYYDDATTSVISEDDVFRRTCFVLAYLSHLRVPVHRVLDAGCGTGLLRRALHRIDRSIEYTGIDPSEYLCHQHGWIQSNVADFKSRRKFDLVVCQDVMQYMSNDEAERSIEAIAAVCRGALYFDVPTREDIDDGYLDMRKTDRNIHVRSAAWYRRRLQKHFVNAGGGVFVSLRSRFVVLALERGC
jgi:2-polyprenyl-3-methyl-5-hydroxy-6-metoxy-1,4-benzoquinol methylase